MLPEDRGLYLPEVTLSDGDRWIAIWRERPAPPWWLLESDPVKDWER